MHFFVSGTLGDRHLGPAFLLETVTLAPSALFVCGAGVLGALEVIRTLNDFNITTRRPIVIASYTDEEGTERAIWLFLCVIFLPKPYTMSYDIIIFIRRIRVAD